MNKNVKNPERLLRKEDRIETRNTRKSTRSKIVEKKLEKPSLSALRAQRLKIRAKRLAKRIEELEMRRQDILRALKTNWIKERDRENG